MDWLFYHKMPTSLCRGGRAGKINYLLYSKNGLAILPQTRLVLLPQNGHQSVFWGKGVKWVALLPQNKNRLAVLSPPPPGQSIIPKSNFMTQKFLTELLVLSFLGRNY